MGIQMSPLKRRAKLVLHWRSLNETETKRPEEGQGGYYSAICPNYTTLITANYFSGAPEHDGHELPTARRVLLL